MGNTVAIELKKLTKRYPGAVLALDSVDLSIERGSLVGLLGPNGSGKSTTVKILAGLIKDFDGGAIIDGLKLPDRRCAPLLGYMPQQSALYAELSVFENLDFFGAINGIRPGAERRKRIDEALALLDLREKRSATVESLSGGMRQRVSLGCAILHRPRILLLDEPTVGLDPELRLSFWSYFKDLAASGATIIICTHAFDEVRHCSHLGFLKSGRLVRYGSLAELGAGSETVDWEAIYMRIAEGSKKGVAA